MSRRKRQYKKEIASDLKYGNQLVAKFINQIMRKGKKTVAQRIVYSAFDILEKQFKKNPLEIFKQALANASPLLEVRSRIIGGATYQVPFEVREPRRTVLAMRWILGAARKKKGQSMEKKLANELISAFNKEGEVIKKRENIHKMAESNRAFAHFA